MEKKKSGVFHNSAYYFRKNDYSITEVVKPVIASATETPVVAPPVTETTQNTEATVEKPVIATPIAPVLSTDEPKISAFSLSSIRAKKALEESSKSIVKEVVHTPTEAFTETEMLLQWTKYAQKLGSKGYRIMESLLLINDPKLDGTRITIELPNEGSKLDFESQKHGLLGHLKGHLHNHEITIDVIVNESIEIKRNLNDQDRYNRLKEINPAIDLLRSTFGLHVDA